METQRKYCTKRQIIMLFVGIDVSKSKHDCCILDSNGVVINDSLEFQIQKKVLILFTIQ